MINRLVVGTRGSPLALAQASQTVEMLEQVAPKFQYEILPIHTRGDKSASWNERISRKDLFTKEIEEALIESRVDIAVHSLKDLTTEDCRGLVIAAVPKRLDPRDALVSRGNRKLSEIPAGAKVGTSSARRKAQLLAARADLDVDEVHGNVNTRIQKISHGQYDAIVLGSAGLARLGLENHIAEVLSTEVMLPAVGQGALAIQCREDAEEIRDLISQIEHQPSRKAIQAERAFARRLGANCETPIAAYARDERRGFMIEGMVATRDGRMIVRSHLISKTDNPERVGEKLAERLLEQGAKTILEVA